MKKIDVALHGEDREVSIEYLDGVVEDFVLDSLSLLIFLDIFCVYLGLTFGEEGSVVLVY